MQSSTAGSFMGVISIEITRNSDQHIETKGNLCVLNDSNATIFNCDSLELKDDNNTPEISCIPKGVYTCTKVGPTHIPYEHISIENVANRTGICCHYGNFATGKKIDILGCIIVGDRYSDIDSNGIDDIVDSKTTFEKLMKILPDTFKLTIK